MGYIAHDAVVAVVSDWDEATIAAIEAFRDTMDDDPDLRDEMLSFSYKQFLVGPVVGVNGYHMYCFLPDGSKEGWSQSEKADSLRHRFREIASGKRFADVGGGHVVHVRFGGDWGHEVGTDIAFTTDPKVRDVEPAR